MIKGKRVKVPTELKTYPINRERDTGQQVVIYKGYFAPETLTANSGTIVFTNLTDQVQEVTFPYFPAPATPLHSGPIPPGQTFKFHHSGTIAAQVCRVERLVRLSRHRYGSGALTVPTDPALATDLVRQTRRYQ